MSIKRILALVLALLMVLTLSACSVAEELAYAALDEISQNLEALVGTTVDTAPKAEPRHPINDTTTAKFANLQFGRNYDPNHK